MIKVMHKLCYRRIFCEVNIYVSLHGVTEMGGKKQRILPIILLFWMFRGGFSRLNISALWSNVARWGPEKKQKTFLLPLKENVKNKIN